MNEIGPVTQNAMLEVCGDINTVFAIDGMKELDSCNGLWDAAHMHDEEKGMDRATVGKKAELEKRIGKKRLQMFLEQKDEKNLWDRAEMIWRGVRESGIEVITREDERYPERFLWLNDILTSMPVLLYAKGTMRINDFQESVGVVGARRCSSDGKNEAIVVVRKAMDRKVAVISGMAKGIDAYAHTASLKAQGYTIAVLGNGVDICYPREHGRLYEAIADHGCILSEYPPGTTPRGYMFPRRNRLIAALSDTLYIVDAGRNSGTRSTAEFAVKYGREVICCTG